MKITPHLKIASIFTLLVIVPLGASIFTKCLVEGEYWFFSWECSDRSFLLLNLALILGSYGSLWLNYKTKMHSGPWYFFAGCMALVVTLDLIFLIGISNFGV